MSAPVILSPSPVSLSPSRVILSVAKNLVASLMVHFAKNLVASLRVHFATNLAVVAIALLAAAPAAAQTQLVIVSGLGGDPKYTTQFAELATTLAQAAHDRGGVPDSAIAWFGEPTAPKSPWYRGASTRVNIEQTLGRLAARPGEEQLVLVLVGHGAGEGAQTRISLPGSDLTAADFARLLDRFGERRVAFINMTSASGDMLALLSAPSRVVVTATKSAFERNESQFARYFVDALAGDGADVDKDDRVSLFEAFAYADAETTRFYESAQRLATEHPQLADEGQLARRFFLTAGVAGATSADPRVKALYAERATLEEQIEALKRRKESLTVEAYETELERLLVSLAEKTREIRRLEGAAEGTP